MHPISILTWIIGVLLLVFVLQNLATVEVGFLVWTIQTPRAVMLLAVFAAGVLVGWLVATLKRGERRSPSSGPSS